MVLPVVPSGISVEISGKKWWYYQWYTSWISVVLQLVPSGISVEISGKKWWYYQWYTSWISVVLPVVSDLHPNRLTHRKCS